MCWSFPHLEKPDFIYEGMVSMGTPLDAVQEWIEGIMQQKEGIAFDTPMTLKKVKNPPDYADLQLQRFWDMLGQWQLQTVFSVTVWVMAGYGFFMFLHDCNVL
jgi:hypothetical protein